LKLEAGFTTPAERPQRRLGCWYPDRDAATPAGAYEKLKGSHTRQNRAGQTHTLIRSLEFRTERTLAMTPNGYVGMAAELAQ
jgi:hypothetical protein